MDHPPENHGALPMSKCDLLVAKYTNGESIEQLQQSLALSSEAMRMRLMRTKQMLKQIDTLASVIGLRAVLSQLKQL